MVLKQTRWWMAYKVLAYKVVSSTNGCHMELSIGWQFVVQVLYGCVLNKWLSHWTAYWLIIGSSCSVDGQVQVVALLIFESAKSLRFTTEYFEFGLLAWIFSSILKKELSVCLCSCCEWVSHVQKPLRIMPITCICHLSAIMHIEYQPPYLLAPTLRLSNYVYQPLCILQISHHT